MPNLFSRLFHQLAGRRKTAAGLPEPTHSVHAMWHHAATGEETPMEQGIEEISDEYLEGPVSFVADTTSYDRNA